MTQEQAFVRSVLVGQVGSTMDVARSLAALIEQDAAVPEVIRSCPIAVLATHQVRGRGRQGRPWLGARSTPPNGMDTKPCDDNEWARRCLERLQNEMESASVPCFSDLAVKAFQETGEMPVFSVLFPRGSVRIPLEWFSLAVGCAVFDAVDELSVALASAVPGGFFAPPLCPKRVYLKWPNDVVVCDPRLLGDGAATKGMPPMVLGKLAGTLVETVWPSGSLVAGVGVNLFRAPGPDAPGALSHLVAQPEAFSPRALQPTQSIPVRPFSVVEALANVPLEADAATDKQKARALERWRQDAASCLFAVTRFTEALERELLEYVTIPRTSGQLRTLAQARMLPVGASFVAVDGSVAGEFLGLADDGALVLKGHQPIYTGDVSLRLALRSDRSGEQLGSEVAHSALQRSKAWEARSSGPQGATVRALLLDLGNTRLHWGMIAADGSGDVEFGHLSYAVLLEPPRVALGDEGVRALLAVLQSQKRNQVSILVCSVKDATETRKTMDGLRALLELAYPEMRHEVRVLTLDWLRSQSPDLDELLAGYGSTMGIDRALRLDYALRDLHRASKTVLIVSLGTATTIEVLGQGGLIESRILPGIQMGLDALTKGTGLLPEMDYHKVTPDSLSLKPGQGTTSSLARGAILTVSDSVLALCQRHHVDKVWICGGSAAHFLRLGGVASLPPGVQVELSENLGLVAMAALLGDGPSASSSVDGVAGRSFRPLLGHDFAPPSAPDVAPLGEHSQKIAETMFKGRRHFRKQAALGIHERSEAANDTDAVDLSLEDFRRLGPRVETWFVGERLDRHLGRRFRFHSRGDWQSRIARQEVLVEHGASQRRATDEQGELLPVKATYRLRPFDQLWLYQPKEFEPAYANDVTVLRDTGDAMAFHKPGNLVVHATGLYGRNTFLDVIAEAGHSQAFPVHRIDRETSGILLCARQPSTRRRLAELFRDGTMKKMYLAFARSFFELPRHLVIDAPIGPAIGSPIRLKMWVGQNDMAQTAQTYVNRLAQIGDQVLLACFPLTGRTNQIRVHLSAAGQWIFGDKMYHPNENVFLQYFEHGLTQEILKICECPRQALHNAVIDGDPQASDIFSDGPVVCPVSRDLLEMRWVRDLLEAGGVGLSMQTQEAALRSIYTQVHIEDIKHQIANRSDGAPVVWTLRDLMEPTERARLQCVDVIGPP
jgi:23S rRNA pseudouridine1911/1915/1917 synthase